MFKVSVEGYTGDYTVNGILKNGTAYLLIMHGVWKIVPIDQCKKLL